MLEQRSFCINRIPSYDEATEPTKFVLIMKQQSQPTCAYDKAIRTHSENDKLKVKKQTTIDRNAFWFSFVGLFSSK